MHWFDNDLGRSQASCRSRRMAANKNIIARKVRSRRQRFVSLVTETGQPVTLPLATQMLPTAWNKCLHSTVCHDNAVSRLSAQSRFSSPPDKAPRTHSHLAPEHCVVRRHVTPMDGDAGRIRCCCRMGAMYTGSTKAHNAFGGRNQRREKLHFSRA